VFIHFRFMSGLSFSLCKRPESKNLIRSGRFLEYLRSRFTRAHSLEPELSPAVKYFFKYISYQMECFHEAMDLHTALNLNSNPMDSPHRRIISNER